MTSTKTHHANLGFFAPSLDEIEILKSIKASNQVEAWCLPVQMDAAALVSFYRNTDNLETSSALPFYIAIKGIRNNNKNPILPCFHRWV